MLVSVTHFCNIVLGSESAPYIHVGQIRTRPMLLLINRAQ